MDPSSAKSLGRAVRPTALAHQIMEWFKDRLPGVGRPELSRLAIGRSLQTDETPTLETDPEGVFPAFREYERPPPAIRLQNLFGDGSFPLWLAAMRDESPEADDTILVRDHWERGLVLLYQDWRADGNLTAFLRRLIRISAKEGG